MKALRSREYLVSTIMGGCLVAMMAAITLVGCSQKIITSYPESGKYKLVEEKNMKSGKNYIYIKNKGETYNDKKNKK